MTQEEFKSSIKELFSDYIKDGLIFEDDMYSYENCATITLIDNHYLEITKSGFRLYEELIKETKSYYCDKYWLEKYKSSYYMLDYEKLLDDIVFFKELILPKYLGDGI